MRCRELVLPTCVLAHEVGHAVARHGAKALQAQWGYQLLMDVAFRGQAVRYAARAGFRPQGMITFLQKLQQAHGDGPADAVMVYWRTHPLYQDRIAQVEQEIARQSGGRP